MDEMTLTLNSPITEEQWDAITDVDFEHTNEIIFHTKHGKEVKFVKASAQQKPKTGHWIEITNNRGTVIALRCSCCEKSPKHAIRSDFCPSCGANMRGEKDGCDTE